MIRINKTYIGDCRESMAKFPEGIVQTCVTSPPYWGLRDYGVDGQLGLEKTPEEYVANMVDVFRAVRRVLRNDGTLWVNLGDSYANGGTKKTGRNDENPEDIERRSVRFKTGKIKALTGGNDTKAIKVQSGCKPKDLVGIPWMVAFALRADGWYLRSDIIWHKPNPMPESVTDRPSRAHEYIFLLSKQEKYHYDADAIREDYLSGFDWIGRNKSKSGKENTDRIDGGNSCNSGNSDGRNKRTIWEVATAPFHGAHFATFPPKLIEPCIKAGARAGDIVLDPFMGSGTTAQVCDKLGRKWIGCDLNVTTEKLQEERLIRQRYGLKGRKWDFGT